MRGAGEHELKATLVSLAPARTCSSTGQLQRSSIWNLRHRPRLLLLHQRGSATDHRQPASRPTARRASATASATLVAVDDHRGPILNRDARPCCMRQKRTF